MKKGFYSVALAAAMMLTAGSANAQVKISGKLDGYTKSNIIVAQRTDNGLKQDTVAVSNGAFEYSDANHLTSSLTKYVFYNWLINNILYLCVT